MPQFPNLAQLKTGFRSEKYLTQHVERLRNLTVLLILIGTPLAVGAFAIASHRLVREVIVGQVKEKALLEVHRGTDEIDRWLAIRKAEVQTLANTATVRSLNWSVAEPYLQAEVKRINEYFLFAMANPDGSYYNTRVGRAKANLKDREYFQKAIAGQVNISDPIISRTTGIPLVAIAAPIRQSDRPNSSPIGIFGGFVKVDRVTQIVNELHYGQGSYAFALNSQGQAIVHPNPKLMATVEQPAPSFLESSDPNLAAIARRMVNKKQGIESIQIDGTLKYIAYVPLQETNWSVALIISRRTIESQLRALNWLAYTLGGLPIIAALVVWRQLQLSQKAKAQVTLLQQQEKTLRQTQAQLQRQARDLEQTLHELQQTHAQLLQSEKMSSLGQLVAGIAHEINNPVNFISGNLCHANEYTQDLLGLLQLYQQHCPHPASEVLERAEAIDLDFIAEDMPKLINSMRVGADRIQKIVASLRNFSRKDEAEMKAVDIHEGIESTLMLLQNRLKAKPDSSSIEVIKDYGNLPLVECRASQLNQVFMNLLTNAIDSLEEREQQQTAPDLQQTPSTIRISTQIVDSNWVRIKIADNGLGIPESSQQQIFDPFFTTKPVGKGTGLGLSISYEIVSEKHRGRLQCHSSSGKGAEFVIEIPLRPIETGN